jgi:glutathione S-transferase
MAMKIYSGPLSMFGAKAEIALLEKGVAHQREHVGFSLATLYEPKHPEVLRINPKAQVPVLIDGDLELFDSTQIFEYLEDRYPSPPLWPRDPVARARARQRELDSDEIFFPNVVALFPHLRAASSAEQLAAAEAAVAAGYARMARALGERDYLAGEFSFADIAFFMAQSFAAFVGAPLDAARHPALGVWRDRVAARPAVKRVIEPMQAYVIAQSGPRRTA